MKLLAELALSAVLLSGCAGRPPNPVAVLQPQDAHTDCAGLRFEANANNARIMGLTGDQSAKVAQNVAAGVVGLIIWPVWFAMDLQGTAGVEIQALQTRNGYLAERAAQIRCDP